MFKVTIQALRKGAQVVRKKIGTPYRLGAEVKPGKLEDARELDCSEMTDRLFNDYFSIKLPDGAANQRLYCEKVGKQVPHSLGVAPQFGDLVFLWDKDMSRIGHVMMVAGDLDPYMGTMLIEARGRPYSMVVITSLDDVLAQFGTRFAGIYRLIEVIS